MGKTKTAFVGTDNKQKSSAEEYKEKKIRQEKEKQEKIHIAGLKGGQRIKTIEAEGPTPEGDASEEEVKTKKAPKIRSKKYRDAKAKVNIDKKYDLDDAIELVKQTSYSKFDGTVELHLLVKKTGTSVNVTLPHQAGKEKRIEIASEETVEKLKSGKIDFDVLVATADMMPKLVPFARLLGPKGLMPNPKNGTLVNDPKKAKSFSANSITLKTEKSAPLIHTSVGKVKQDQKELLENTKAVLSALGGGKQVIKAYLKATMGPSVKLAI